MLSHLNAVHSFIRHVQGKFVSILESAFVVESCVSVCLSLFPSVSLSFMHPFVRAILSFFSPDFVGSGRRGVVGLWCDGSFLQACLSCQHTADF